MIEITLKPRTAEELAVIMQFLDATMLRPVAEEQAQATSEMRQAQEATDEATAAETIEVTPDDIVPTQVAYTEDDVKAALTQYGKDKGAIHLKALLEKHGCKRVSDLDPSDYADVMKEIS